MSSNQDGKNPPRNVLHGVGGPIALGGIASVLLMVVAVVVANRATRESRQVVIAADSRTGSLPANPSGELNLPYGPHLQEFQDSCLTCHSARLPLGQPPFGRKKWAEIVNKMTVVYGAPMTPEAQSDVVDYILSVRPPES